MTYQQASELRRAARRDDDLSDTAYRLLCEVIDLHMLPDGCTARDATFAHWIGASERTIQRRRTELEEAGYLAVEGRGATRKLVPKVPDLSSEVANTPNLSDKSGEPEHAKNGEHKEYIYNPPPGGSESARPCEAPSPIQHRHDVEQKPAVPDDPVAAHEQATGEALRSQYFKDLIRARVGTEPGDLELWYAECEEWAAQGYNCRNIKNLIRKFQDSRDDHERQPSKNQRDETYSESFQRILRAGTEA